MLCLSWSLQTQSSIRFPALGVHCNPDSCSSCPSVFGFYLWSSSTVLPCHQGIVRSNQCYFPHAFCPRAAANWLLLENGLGKHCWSTLFFEHIFHFHRKIFNLSEYNFFYFRWFHSALFSTVEKLTTCMFSLCFYQDDLHIWTSLYVFFWRWARLIICIQYKIQKLIGKIWSCLVGVNWHFIFMQWIKFPLKWPKSLHCDIFGLC